MRRSIFLAAVLIAEPLRLVYFSRMGLSTDWLLGLVVLAALVTRPPRGAVIGFVLGAGRDLMTGQPVGFEAMMFCLAAWLIGVTSRSVYREAFVTQTIMVFATALLHGAVLYLRTVGDLAGMFSYLWGTVLLGALPPAIVIPLGYHALKYLMRPRLGEDLEAMIKESQIQRPRGMRF